jgi:Arc/MetJ family transcription regulator
MRTTITIDDEAIREVMQLTGEKTAVAAIREALDRYRRIEAKRRVLALRGEVQIEDTWRQLRELETKE